MPHTHPETCRRDRPMPSSTNGFSIISWNVLAQCYVDTGRAAYEYAGVLKDWPVRRVTLFDTLRLLNADIVCLQEVMFTLFDEEFQPFFDSLGYECVMQNHSKRSAGHPVGNATFFKRSCFTLTWADHRSRALLVGLQSVAHGRNVAVANVHLEGHYLEHHTRASQVKSLLKQLEKKGSDACIITGDFNHSLSGSLEAILLDRSIEAGYTQDEVVVVKEHFKHTIELSSAYGKDRTPTFVMPPTSHYRLDHVLFTHRTMRPAAVLDVMPEEDRDEIMTRSLPNRRYPSDHLTVGASFEWL